MIIIPELFGQDVQLWHVTVADEITLTLCATSTRRTLSRLRDYLSTDTQPVQPHAP